VRDDDTGTAGHNGFQRLMDQRLRLWRINISNSLNLLRFSI
jgi:hypothetical protein